MSNQIQTGLDILLGDKNRLQKLGDHVGYLGHEASVTAKLKPGYLALHESIGSRLDRLFGPQHGFNTLDQDNMIETDHQIHPYLGIPIYSLYTETRDANPAMLKGLDSLIIDLQDVGTRVYTYIWTMYLILKSCLDQQIKVIILDRPNPIGGEKIEGNLPDQSWYSFVCMSQIPMRHGLTIAEMALFFNQEMNHALSIEIIQMKGWKRAMYWADTGLPWVNPSPNLPTPSGTIVYPGSVLIEGTVLSEGRGTTRSLELFGHPTLDPYKMKPILDKQIKAAGLDGYCLRPTSYRPTFDKFSGQICGGFQIHCTDSLKFEPWKLVQHILKILYHNLNLPCFWNTEAYEYETEGLAIDYINGNSDIRRWIENEGTAKELSDLEIMGVEQYQKKIKNILLYSA